MNKHGEKAKHFRKRALEIRAEAVDVTDKRAREILMEAARDYEEMAAGRETIALTLPKLADTNSI